MLKELFAKNKKIVINTDIDGFLCGMLLQKYYGCKVVGFSNSRETIWIKGDIDDMNKPIYIDIFVANPNVFCIDQHIIAYDRDHHEEIMSYGTKINPNLARKRTFVGDMESDYYHKYPFGTVHFIIAMMAKEGINVELPDLNKIYTITDPKRPGRKISTNAGHVILRADDALYSTLSPYRANALDWWNWLDSKREIPAINALRKFIDECDIAKAADYKTEVGDFFMALGCDGKDGAFKTVTNEEGQLLTKVIAYKEMICEIMGMELDLPLFYDIHKGRYAVQFAKPGYDMDILHAENLYSYAFIYGPRPKYPNFSFTLDMK